MPLVRIENPTANPDRLTHAQPAAPTRPLDAAARRHIYAVSVQHAALFSGLVGAVLGALLGWLASISNVARENLRQQETPAREKYVTTK